MQLQSQQSLNQILNVISYINFPFIVLHDSNGDIVVSVKGSKKLSVEYNFQYGSGQNKRKIDVLNATDFVRAIESKFPSLTNQLGIDETKIEVFQHDFLKNYFTQIFQDFLHGRN